MTASKKPKIQPQASPSPMAPPPRPNAGPYKPDKLAVASETGQNIDACFGRVDKFLIYQLIQSENGPTYEFVEERAGPCPCQDKKHDQALLSQRADLLSDCGLVLAGRIGPAASQALSERGLLALSAHLPIKEALKKLAQK